MSYGQKKSDPPITTVPEVSPDPQEGHDPNKINWSHLSIVSICLFFGVQIGAGILFAIVFLIIGYEDTDGTMITLTALMTYCVLGGWLYTLNGNSDHRISQQIGMHGPNTLVHLIALPFIIYVVSKMLGTFVTLLFVDADTLGGAAQKQLSELNIQQGEETNTPEKSGGIDVIEKISSINFNFMMWLNFLAIVILAPIVEEIVFRGILLRAFLEKYGPTVAMVLSSLIFALVHFQFFLSIILFAIGMGCAYLTLKTKSLKPAIAMHMMNNGIAYIMAL